MDKAREVCGHYLMWAHHVQNVHPGTVVTAISVVCVALNIVFLFQSEWGVIQHVMCLNKIFGITYIMEMKYSVHILEQIRFQ